MQKITKKVLSVMLVIAMIVTICPQMQLFNVSADDNSPYCISVGRPAYASSTKENNSAEFAVDGDEGTRWESAWPSDKVEVETTKNSETDSSFQIGAIEERPGVTIDRNDGLTGKVIWTSWTNIDGATYKVYVNNQIAGANDNYNFTNHSAPNGQIVVPTYGEYTIKVEAYVNGRLVATATRTSSGSTGGSTGGNDSGDFPQWLYVDLGKVADVYSFYIQWEGAYSKNYKIQYSNDEENWADCYTNSNGNGGKENITLNNRIQARYVRIYMTNRSIDAYGYSIFEFQVFGLNGVVKRPESYGENLALNKRVSASSLRDIWWMYDDNGNIDQSTVKAENAVDGDMNTSFTSSEENDQWLMVDLGRAYTIGRIAVDWTQDAAKIYDYQVSSNGTNWTTVYRTLEGRPELKDNVQVYAENVRYVRIFGYTKVESKSGIGIKELEVYAYKQGDQRVTHTIPQLPQSEIKKNQSGKGSYLSNSMYNEKTKVPYYKTDDIETPIDSNDFWQSILIKRFGNTLCTMPLKTNYSTQGLAILTATDGWLMPAKDTDVQLTVASESKMDFYIVPENLDGATAYDRVAGYSDFSVTAQLCDEEHVAMTSTHVKGSPYVYTEYGDTESITIKSSNITSIFDGNGNEILKSGSVNADHIGIEITDNDNKNGTYTSKSYYCLTVPQGTVFKKVGTNIKIIFPGKNGYMSVGAMHNKGQINTFYQHGYAFVTKTAVTYQYDDNKSVITSNYNVTTTLKRDGFPNTTVLCMLPHQWKNSTDDNNAFDTYKSVRGDMKAIESNSFKTVSDFSGLIPTFATPKKAKFNDGTSFDTDALMKYLRQLENATNNLNPAADAYWEGKNLHPLGMGALMADQIGETELRDTFLARMKKILVNWFTYDGKDDISYLIYNPAWGTLYYEQSEFGANDAICDHHFTYGYFVFGATVLAMYDKEFYNDYKDMIEMLMRDYANPVKDSEYCRFRAYDLYEGHSWAGGYADNESGNNQESASESLFSWVSMYLWGVLTENDSYRDAGVFGFTNEMEAVKQYWFNYDKDNWIKDWPYQVVAQVYGGINFYGTFFGGQPLYCYGIQWLPISEYLTYYGMNQSRAAEIYQGLLNDTTDAMRKAEIAARNEGKSQEEIDKLLKEYPQADTGWQHITWPFLAQTNSDLAMEKFLANDSKLQKTDTATTYWFISALKEVGTRSTEYKVAGDIAGSVYYNSKTNQYTAEIWNPTSKSKTATIIDKNGNVKGTAVVGGKSLISFEIDTRNQFNISQMSAPTVKAQGLADGVISDNLTGSKTFSDTQLVELKAENGATIYYTTDGTAPTKESPKYEGKILISSNMTLKAIAVKDGYVDSPYASVTFKIDGDQVESGTNLALNKTATASSENGNNKANQAVDGNTSSRWESLHTESEWFSVDLGKVQAVNTVKINWEAAYASKYNILVSTDGKNWEKVATENGSLGEVTTSFAAVNARYVKMEGVSRATDYGYSFYEFEVYGAKKANAPTITPVSGTYTGAQTITMSTTVKGAEIKYTTDGSDPTEYSNSYTGPITVNSSVVIKAVTYRKGMTLSDVTQSSIIITGTVSISETSINVAYGKTKQISAISDQKVTWSSANTAIATVDQNGVVKGVTKGTTTITATIPNGQKATCTVNVTDQIHITNIVLSDTDITLQKKTSKTLEATILPENTTDDKVITWTSSNTAIATVNENGTITAKAEGTVTITAKSGNVTSTCKVTVVGEASPQEMIEDANYNVSLGKKVTISSIYSGEGSQTADVLTDGNVNSNYVSTDWDNSRVGEYIIIDLGDKYATKTLDRIAMQFKSDAVTFPSSINVQYSADGTNYVTVADVSGLKYENSDKGLITIDVNDKSAQLPYTRYVKINMPGHLAWGFQIREAAVLSTYQNATTEKGEVPTEKPAEKPTERPTEEPTEKPTEEPTEEPTEKPEDPSVIRVSKDVNIEGYQISTSVDGIRVIGSVEEKIDGQDVKEWGFIYGLAKVNGSTTGITDKDVYVRDTEYVKAYASTAQGTSSQRYSESKTAVNYIRTMSFGGMNKAAFEAEYKVRAYALLSDGTYVYSEVSNYSIYQVAEYIYRNNLMPNMHGHDYLYERIINVVNQNYAKIAYKGTILVMAK